MTIETNRLDLTAYAKDLRCDLFATHSDFPAALSYAYGVIATLPKKDHAAAFTMLHVVLNTVASDLTQQ